MADSNAPESPSSQGQGVHLAAASALAAVFGAVPAALLSSYKYLGIFIAVVTMLLYLAVAAPKLRDSINTVNRRALLVGAVSIAFIASWSLTGWSMYRLRQGTPAAVAPAVAAPALIQAAPVAPPATTTTNNIQNSGTGNPVITGGNGSVYIGDSVAGERERRRNAKHP